MSRIQQYESLLNLLSRAETEKEITDFLDIAGSEPIKLIAEIAHNILTGNIPLTPDQREEFKKYKNQLRILKGYRVKLEDRKNQLRGGNIGLLYPLIFPLVSSLITKLLKGEDGN